MTATIQAIDAARAEVARAYPDSPPLALVRSYGCQQNVSDGEKIKGVLAEIGYGLTDNLSDADLILYNTCAVREHAEMRIMGNVGALKHYKARKPGLILGLGGCMVQQDEVADRIQRSFPHVDLLFGPGGLTRLPDLLRETLAKRPGRRAVVRDLGDADADAFERLPIRRDGAVKAFVPVMFGCDNFCSYCVVPHVRGRERSRRREDILREVRGLVEAGAREITLLGQNVNSYREAADQAPGFADLLRAIDRIPGDYWIRFMTSHPRDATRELIDTIAGGSHIARQIHLPVQSGSDRILAAMNRGYTAARYRELIGYTKEKIPGIGLSSDIIVGFPGETEADFQATLDLIRDIQYDNLFTFIYSPRRGTPAADMEDPTPAADKSARMRRLLEVQRAITTEKNKRAIGTAQRVLCEAPGDEPGQFTGHNSAGLIVQFKSEDNPVGQFVDVNITASRNFALVGEQ